MTTSATRATAAILRSAEEASEVLALLEAALSAVHLPSDRRLVIAAACFGLAIEHHRSIVMLAQVGLFGTAFALVRIMFEAFARGMWFATVASADQVKSFDAGTLTLGIKRMLHDVQKFADFHDPDKGALLKEVVALMHGLTHSDFEQIRCRVRGNVIEPNYSEVDVLEVVEFSRYISCASGALLLMLGQKPSESIYWLDLGSAWPSRKGDPA